MTCNVGQTERIIRIVASLAFMALHLQGNRRGRNSREHGQYGQG
jgi:hypothetical protein